MTKRTMLINATPSETRVAIVENGTLQDLHVESLEQNRLRGNIYKGTVVRVEPAIQACFVDFGGNRNGFLALSDITQNWYKKEPSPQRKRRIEDLINPGMHMIVQCVREPEGNKGAALTTSISLPGRYIVLLPDADNNGGVSKKILDEAERKRLKAILKKMAPKMEGHSVIVRTMGIGRNKTELERDLTQLTRFWKNIKDAFKKAPRPGPLFLEQDVVVRSVRDYFSTDTEEVLVDSAEAYKRATAYVHAAMPRHIKRFKLYTGKRPLFASRNVESQIEQTFQRQVPLPSGGSIVIDRTEALVAVDTNSGRAMGGKSMEETALNTNLEAAVEVARQLKLRDLGGLIVIDFIDLRLQRNRRKVEAALKKALKTDKARTNVGSISQFGLLEMSRQRIQGAITAASHEQCKACLATGLVRTVSSYANATMRKIHDIFFDKGINAVQAVVPVEVAIHILNEERSTIETLERTLGVDIKVFPDNSSRADVGNFYTTRGERRPTIDTTTQDITQAPSSDTDALPPSESETNDDAQFTLAEEGETTLRASEHEDDSADRPRRKRRRRRRRGRGRRQEEGQAQSSEAREDDQEVTHLMNPANALDELTEQDERAPHTDNSSEDAAHDNDDDNDAQTSGRRRGRGRRRRRRGARNVGDNEQTEQAQAPSNDDAQRGVQEEENDSEPRGRRRRRRRGGSRRGRIQTQENNTPELENGPDLENEDLEPPSEELSTTSDEAAINDLTSAPPQDEMDTAHAEGASEPSPEAEEPSATTNVSDDERPDEEVAQSTTRRSRRGSRQRSRTRRAASPESSTEEGAGNRRKRRRTSSKRSLRDNNAETQTTAPSPDEDDPQQQLPIIDSTADEVTSLGQEAPKTPAPSDDKVNDEEATAPSAEEEPSTDARPKRTRRSSRRSTRATKASEEATSEATDAQTGDSGEDKPKPKRQTRRRKSPAKEVASEAQSQDDAVQTEEAQEGPADTTKRKRSTRRKTSAKAQDAVATEEAAQDGDDSTTPSAAPKKKPATRSRKRTVKATGSESTTKPAEESSTDAETAAENAEDGEAQKKTTRTRKTTARKTTARKTTRKTTATKEPSSPDDSNADDAEEQAPATAEPPKKKATASSRKSTTTRRKTTSKTAAKTSDSDGAAEGATGSPDDDATPEPPVKKTRARRTRKSAKTSEATEPQSQIEDQPKGDAANTDDPAPKPKRTRRTRKTTASAATSTTTADDTNKGDAADTDEKKPKRQTRRRRGKTVNTGDKQAEDDSQA